MYLIDTNDLGFAQRVPTQIKNTTGFPDGPEELDDHIGDQQKKSAMQFHANALHFGHYKRVKSNLSQSKLQAFMVTHRSIACDVLGEDPRIVGGWKA